MKTPEMPVLLADHPCSQGLSGLPSVRTRSTAKIGESVFEPRAGAVLQKIRSGTAKGYRSACRPSGKAFTGSERTFCLGMIRSRLSLVSQIRPSPAKPRGEGTEPSDGSVKLLRGLKRTCLKEQPVRGG